MKDSLYPANPTAQRFFKYFSHHWDFITAPAGTKDWKTVKDYKLSPRVLWRRYQDEQESLGVRFGQTTSYGMADVDILSSLHFFNNPQAFQDLCHAFESIGLCRFVVIYSSHSQGLHLYFPLPEDVNTFDLACALRMAAETAGFKIKSGQLEIFPNTKQYKKNDELKDFSYYNGHRLPLQPESGSLLLDDDLAPYSDNLEEFLAQMDIAATGQDMEQLTSALSLARDWYKKRRYRYWKSKSTAIQAWQQDTEAIINEGFTDYGQTNDLLREIGKNGRVFKALAGAELINYMIETITQLPGYQQYCRHKHEIKQRCQHWAKIIEPFWWPLGTTPTRHQTYQEMNQKGQTSKNSNLNQKRSADCKNRLQQIVDHLLKQVIALPQKISDRIKLICETSQKLFGIAFSQRTLKKADYRAIWHPKYNGEQTQKSLATAIKTKPTTEPQDITVKSSQPEKSVSEKPSKKKITPPSKPEKIAPREKPLESPSGNEYKHLDHTPPYMKGFCENIFISRQVDRSSCILKQTQPKQLQRQKLNQKCFNKSFQESNCFQNSANPKSISLYKQIQHWAKNKVQLVYEGVTRSNLVQTKEQNRPKLKSIESGEKVIICSLDHSSFMLYPEEEEKMQVYVKPLSQLDSWSDGIAVKASCLQPKKR